MLLQQCEVHLQRKWVELVLGQHTQVNNGLFLLIVLYIEGFRGLITVLALVTLWVINKTCLVIASDFVSLSKVFVERLKFQDLKCVHYCTQCSQYKLVMSIQCFLRVCCVQKVPR